MSEQQDSDQEDRPTQIKRTPRSCLTALVILAGLSAILAFAFSRSGDVPTALNRSAVEQGKPDPQRILGLWY